MCNFEGCIIYMELGKFFFNLLLHSLKCVFMNLLFNQADFQSVNCSLLTKRETFETW